MKLCKAPDRDVPRMICGYPMPCPHHTESGARKLRVLLLLNDRAERTKAAPLRPVRIFGIPLGVHWRAICEKYLSSSGEN